MEARTLSSHFLGDCFNHLAVRQEMGTALVFLNENGYTLYFVLNLILSV